MSFYSKCWNWRRILKFLSNFELLLFQLKKTVTKFWGTLKLLSYVDKFWAFCDHWQFLPYKSWTVWTVKPFHYLNFDEFWQNLGSGPDWFFFQLKIKKKTKIQNWTTISIFDANFNTLNMTWSAHLPHFW